MTDDSGQLATGSQKREDRSQRSESGRQLGTKDYALGTQESVVRGE